MAEEPVKPRGRKPQPATLSMFEWAMSIEQEREEGRVARKAEHKPQGQPPF